jgi:hypothetical protein
LPFLKKRFVDQKTTNRGGILGRIQKKVLKVFLLAIEPYLNVCLEIFISSNFHTLLHFSTVQLLYTVQEREGKPDRKPYPLVFG